MDAQTVFPLRWIKLNKYCELSGDTRDAVHTRRRKGVWIDGMQCRIGPDGNLWINPEEVSRWVESDSVPGQGWAARELATMRLAAARAKSATDEA